MAVNGCTKRRRRKWRKGQTRFVNTIHDYIVTSVVKSLLNHPHPKSFHFKLCPLVLTYFSFISDRSQYVDSVLIPLKERPNYVDLKFSLSTNIYTKRDLLLSLYWFGPTAPFVNLVINETYVFFKVEKRLETLRRPWLIRPTVFDWMREGQSRRKIF